MIRVKAGKSYELWQDGQLMWGPGTKREMEAYEYRLAKLKERKREWITSGTGEVNSTPSS